MKTEFDVLLTSINEIEVHLPQIGNVRLLPGKGYQLLNAKAEVINALRSMFTGTGVTINLNKKVPSPYFAFDYSEISGPKSVKEIIADKTEHHTPEDPFAKLSNYELPSGKYKGQKLGELSDDTLKSIYKFSKTETVKAAIDAYFAIKKTM